MQTVPLAVSLSHCEFSMRRAIAVHRRGAWPEEAALDTVTLASVDRHRRRIRLVADFGAGLSAGFAAGASSGSRVTVSNWRAAATSGPRRRAALEITPPAADLLRIAWHLGNRHLPLQVAGRDSDRADHVIAEWCGLGGRIIAWRRPSTRESAPYGRADRRRATARSRRPCDCRNGDGARRQDYRSASAVRSRNRRFMSMNDPADPSGICRLLAWLSPAFPVGSFAFPTASKPRLKAAA